VALLVVLFFSVKRDRENQELASSIQDLKKAGASVEAILAKEYKMTAEEAIREVQQMAGNLMNIITWLSGHL